MKFTLIGLSLNNEIAFTFREVQVEEITVQNCLYYASNDSDEVVVFFRVVTPDPVEDIQS